MRKRLYAVLSLGAVFLAFTSSCIDYTRTSLNRDPDTVWEWFGLANRYCTVDISGMTVKPVIVNELPPTPTPKKDITNLAPAAQVALINALAKSGKLSSDELMSKLGHQFATKGASTPPAAKPADNQNYINETRVISNIIKKEIYITSRKNSNLVDDDKNKAFFNSKSNYISMLEVEIQPEDATKMKFSSWDSYKTIYGIIDLGKVSASQELNLKASISAKAGQNITKANDISTEISSDDNSETNNEGDENNTNTSNTKTIKKNNKNTNKNNKNAVTNIDIGPSADAAYVVKSSSETNPKNKIIIFSGILQPSRMLVKQTGARESYVEGLNKVLVDCEVTADWAPPIVITKFESKQLYNSEKQLIPLKNLYYKRILVTFPLIDDIYVNYRYNFDYRAVKTGASNSIESKQTIKYIHGRVGYQKPDSTSKNKNKERREIEKIGDIKRQLLIPKTDLRPTTYKLTINKSDKMHFLKIKGTELNFDTKEEALNFIEYLYRIAEQTDKEDLNNPTISYSNINLKDSEVSGIKITEVKN